MDHRAALEMLVEETESWKGGPAKLWENTVYFFDPDSLHLLEEYIDVIQGQIPGIEEDRKRVFARDMEALSPPSSPLLGVGVLMGKEGFILTSANVGKKITYAFRGYAEKDNNEKIRPPYGQAFDRSQFPLDPTLYIEVNNLALVRAARSAEFPEVDHVRVGRHAIGEEEVRKYLKRRTRLRSYRAAIPVKTGSWAPPFNMYSFRERFDAPSVSPRQKILMTGNNDYKEEYVHSNGERLVIIDSKGIQEPDNFFYTGLTLTGESEGSGVFSHTKNLQGIVRSGCTMEPAMAYDAQGKLEGDRVMPVTPVTRVTRGILKEMVRNYKKVC